MSNNALRFKRADIIKTKFDRLTTPRRNGQIPLTLNVSHSRYQSLQLVKIWTLLYQDWKRTRTNCLLCARKLGRMLFESFIPVIHTLSIRAG